MNHINWKIISNSVWFRDENLKVVPHKFKFAKENKSAKNFCAHEIKIKIIGIAHGNYRNKSQSKVFIMTKSKRTWKIIQCGKKLWEIVIFSILYAFFS